MNLFSQKSFNNIKNYLLTREKWLVIKIIIKCDFNSLCMIYEI